MSQEERAVSEALSQFWRSMETKDMNLVAESFADDHDMIVFGTEPGERYVGYGAFEAAMKEKFAAFDSWHFSKHDEVIKVHDSGKVAWWSLVFDAVVKLGEQEIRGEGVRVSGVSVERDGRWKIVQYHASVPSPIDV